MPASGGSLELTTYSDNVPDAANKEEAQVGAGLGGSGALNFELYVGPKDADFLRTVDKKLEQIIDWGWAGFIAKPLFGILHWLYNSVTHNWGWAIVLMTVLINTVLFPAAPIQHEVVQAHAGDSAAGERPQRKVQGHPDERSAQSGTESGIDGSVQKA
ncbi:MAG: membrane protein insertase YidC [Acidobacteriota bacterium]